MALPIVLRTTGKPNSAPCTCGNTKRSSLTVQCSGSMPMPFPRKSGSVIPLPGFARTVSPLPFKTGPRGNHPEASPHFTNASKPPLIGPFPMSSSWMDT
eukprot:scaffold795_cov187-Amphora_coffeaeformis.AAC.18